MVNWLLLLTRIASDKNLQEAIAKFVEFIKSLNDAEAAAYLSKFEPFKGYGNSYAEECPECPAECVEVEELILASLIG